MKSLQVFFVSALLVICAANPVPDEAAVSPTSAPASEIAQPTVTPSVKSSAETYPAVIVPITDVPSVKALDEKVPEPQALPSKKEENAPPKAEGTKREIPAGTVVTATEEKPAAQSTKNVQPIDHVAATPKALAEAATPSQITEASTATKVATKSVENVQPLALDATQQSVTAPVEAETKQVAATPNVESTAVPAAISSEKKIDAESPVPIVSENVSQQVQPELKSAPVAVASSAQPTTSASISSESSSSGSSSSSSSSSAEKNTEPNSDESSAESSEESKESKEKKSA